MLLEEIPSNTMLEATAYTLLFFWSDRMSWTLTSQTISSNAKTNVLPSFKSYTARSKKCFLLSSGTVYFIDFERHTPHTVLVQPVNKLERNSKEQITSQKGKQLEWVDSEIPKGVARTLNSSLLQLRNRKHVTCFYRFL